MVTVIVGHLSRSRRFIAHKDVLCRSSKFLGAQSSGDRLSADKTIVLREQNPTAFSIYLNWCYTSQVDLWAGEPSPTTWVDRSGAQRPGTGLRYEHLIRSYILGETIEDMRFCNTLIDSWFQLKDEAKHLPGPDETNLIFGDLSETSKLRELVTHELAYTLDYELYKPMEVSYMRNVTASVAGRYIDDSPGFCSKN